MQAGISEDGFLDGAVTLEQPRRGYRVNVDSLLLAAFAARGRTAEFALDLGAGVGAVGLFVFHAGAARRLALVERDAFLTHLAARNLARAGAPGRILELELGRLPRELHGSAELVVANPPFFPPGTGRPRHDGGQRAARTGSLAPFLRAAACGLAGPRSRAAFVYPAAATALLLSAAESVGLSAKRLRYVHGRADAAARLVLVELRRAKPGNVTIEPPLVEWSAPGRRTPELAAIVAGRLGPR